MLTDSDHQVGVISPPRQKKLLFYLDESTNPAGTSSESLLDKANIGRGSNPPLSHELRKLNAKPIYNIDNETEWHFSRIVRIPDDDHVRPSTLKGTQTPIRVKHKFVVEIKYRLADGKKDMLLTMSTDLVIASVSHFISRSWEGV